MTRSIRMVAALAAAAGLSLTGVVAAQAAPAARLNASDIAFLKSNEQVNLAEIALGGIVLQRSHGPRARELARMTIRDHRKAMAANKDVARKDGVRLPTQPSAAQRKTAAALRTAKRPALTYFQDQVAGHKTSIAQTKAEIKHGSKPDVVRYAKYYLPIAQMHLRMSERDLRHLQHS